MTICPYCTKAKILFDSLDIPYEVIDITNNEEELDRLSQKTGRDTVSLKSLKEIDSLEDI